MSLHIVKISNLLPTLSLPADNLAVNPQLKVKTIDNINLQVESTGNSQTKEKLKKKLNLVRRVTNYKHLPMHPTPSAKV